VTTSGPHDDSPSGLSDQDRSTLLRLARQALVDYLRNRTLPDCRSKAPALLEHRPTFVTLRRHDTGELRGCRGECVARQPLIESVAHMAIASATEDPRFPPVTVDEIPRLHIEISALTPLEPIRPEDVEVGRHGLMIVRGPVSGLLLPQVAQSYNWDRVKYLDAVCWKAGLPRDAWRGGDVELYAFEAEVWKEDD
jgi:AmmeMemoRadiSam system protein A